MMIGTDAGIPSMFHNDATWREMVKWVELGVSPMETIQSATLWPARFLRNEANFGVLASGRFAESLTLFRELIQRNGIAYVLKPYTKNTIKQALDKYQLLKQAFTTIG